MRKEISVFQLNLKIFVGRICSDKMLHSQLLRAAFEYSPPCMGKMAAPATDCMFLRARQNSNPLSVVAHSHIRKIQHSIPGELHLGPGQHSIPGDLHLGPSQHSTFNTW